MSGHRNKFQTWFTSDLHFGHENIISYCNRPWDGVAEMNDGLVERWNSVVDEKDVVWVLGDVVWGSVSSAAPWLDQLKGEKFLVPGNHDTVWAGHKKPTKHGEWQKLGFHVMNGTVPVAYHKQKFLTCHFPYVTADYTDERYDQYKPRDHGAWLLHGHVHDAWQVQGRQINVGVDVWDWTPVNVETLIDIKEGTHERRGNDRTPSQPR